MRYDWFIDSLFRQMGIDLACPDYTVLSKRLAELGINVPKYNIKKDQPDDAVHAIAIDSTGLKRFGRGEWHQEKYELSSKASWRKLHLAINQDHYIEACVLIDRFSHDESQLKPWLEQIDEPIDHFSGDGAYDETPVYIKTNGRMEWQKAREYGRRNYSELGVQRYQRTFGDTMHARDFPRQQQEAISASGAHNKMTSLGMPQSHRSV